MRSGCAARNSRAPRSGFVKPPYEVAGLHSSSPARFVIGIVLAATGDVNGPMAAIVRGSPAILRTAAAPRAGTLAAIPTDVVRLHGQLDAGEAAGIVRLVDGELHGVADSDTVGCSIATQRHVHADRPVARRKPGGRLRHEPADGPSSDQQQRHAAGQRGTRPARQPTTTTCRRPRGRPGGRLQHREELDRLGDALQLTSASRLELDREDGRRESPDGLADQDLARACLSADPRGDVDG